MTVITPDYYNSFKCIADRCKHSCCIGWEIDIDSNTLQKYRDVNGDYADRLKSNIDFGDTPHFKLGKDKRCPFLNKSGLCDIITNLGEDMLCQICSDHPRFRNFYDDFTEIGLGLCCEAAAEIILTKKDKTTLNLTNEQMQSPILRFRENLFDVLQERAFSMDERIDNMLALIGRQLPINLDWYDIFDGLEKMDKAWDRYLLRIKDGISPAADSTLDTAYEQLAVYLVFRHFTDCRYDDRAAERVMFIALIYKLIKAMNISDTTEELIDIARIFSCEIEYSDENIDAILSALE